MMKFTKVLLTIFLIVNVLTNVEAVGEEKISRSAKCFIHCARIGRANIIRGEKGLKIFLNIILLVDNYIIYAIALNVVLLFLYNEMEKHFWNFLFLFFSPPLLYVHLSSYKMAPHNM